jgi:hypothetical protein
MPEVAKLQQARFGCNFCLFSQWADFPNLEALVCFDIILMKRRFEG